VTNPVPATISTCDPPTFAAGVFAATAILGLLAPGAIAADVDPRFAVLRAIADEAADGALARTVVLPPRRGLRRAGGRPHTERTGRALTRS